MKLRITRIGLAALALGAPALASAQMATEREVVVERQVVVERSVRPTTVLTRADIASIEDRRDHAARQRLVANKFSAADYQELRRQRHEVNALIRRLESGQSVSVAEMDQALGFDREIVVYTQRDRTERY
jgi:hypothetical protein